MARKNVSTAEKTEETLTLIAGDSKRTLDQLKNCCYAAFLRGRLSVMDAHPARLYSNVRVA